MAAVTIPGGSTSTALKYTGGGPPTAGAGVTENDVRASTGNVVSLDQTATPTPQWGLQPRPNSADEFNRMNMGRDFFTNEEPQPTFPSQTERPSLGSPPEEFSRPPRRCDDRNGNNPYTSYFQNPIPQVTPTIHHFIKPITQTQVTTKDHSQPTESVDPVKVPTKTKIKTLAGLAFIAGIATAIGLEGAAFVAILKGFILGILLPLPAAAAAFAWIGFVPIGLIAVAAMVFAIYRIIKFFLIDPWKEHALKKEKREDNITDLKGNCDILTEKNKELEEQLNKEKEKYNNIKTLANDEVIQQLRDPGIQAHLQDLRRVPPQDLQNWFTQCNTWFAQQYNPPEEQYYREDENELIEVTEEATQPDQEVEAESSSHAEAEEPQGGIAP